jgi:hypothetical protein
MQNKIAAEYRRELATDLHFLETYERLAVQGLCDAPYSMEFHRVRAEWWREGQPVQIEYFIEQRASVGATGAPTLEDVMAALATTHRHAG